MCWKKLSKLRLYWNHVPKYQVPSSHPDDIYKVLLYRLVKRNTELRQTKQTVNVTSKCPFLQIKHACNKLNIFNILQLREQWLSTKSGKIESCWFKAAWIWWPTGWRESLEVREDVRMPVGKRADTASPLYLLRQDVDLVHEEQDGDAAQESNNRRVLISWTKSL